MPLVGVEPDASHLLDECPRLLDHRDFPVLSQITYPSDSCMSTAVVINIFKMNVIDQHSWLGGQLPKVIWLTAFLAKKKMLFIWHFWSASWCPTSKFEQLWGNILIEKYFLYTKYLDNIHDFTVIIFTRLTYENKTFILQVLPSF